jgi:hypothetical protein
LAGLVGFPLLVVGIILIPLPGPGVLVSLLAFFVLSLGFDWAKKYLEEATGVIKSIWLKSQERAERFEQKYGDKKGPPKK